MLTQRNLVILFLAISGGVVFSNHSFAGPTFTGDDDIDPIASLRCSVSESEQQHPVITFDEDSTSLKVDLDDKKKLAMVAVKGHLHQKEDALIWSGQKVQVNPQSDPPNEFQLPVRLLGKSTLIRLSVVNSYGGIIKKNCIIFFRDYTMWESIRSKKYSIKPTNWSAGLGLSMISYQETGIADLSETAITVKGGYSRPINDRWSTAVGGYFTLLPLSSSSPTQTIRFIGLNGRIGYRIPWITAPWSFSIMGGGYFTTTQTSPSGEFGFSNMAGPQIYPVISRALTRNDAISTYFKYSSVSQGLSLSGVGNELAAGLSYIRRASKDTNLVLSVDAAQLKMKIDDLLEISSRSVSFSLGLGW